MGRTIFAPSGVRLTLLAVALSFAFALVAASPAFGQGDVGDVNEGDDQFNVGDETVYTAVCQNILGAFEVQASQYAQSDAVAVGGDNAAAVAEIAQEQNVSVEQVNECLNQVDLNGDGVVEVGEIAKAGGAAGGGGSASAASASAASASATALPATGGMVPSSVLALGAVALLVGGGLLARRIVR